MIVSFVMSLKDRMLHKDTKASHVETTGLERPERGLIICRESYLSTDPGLLQQVLFDLGSLYSSSFVEVDVDVFPETG